MIYESHITVKDYDREEFISACRQLGVKPVIIENDTGSNINQMMTAAFHKTTSQDEAMLAMYDIADQFGSKVIRRKLEKILKKHEVPTGYLYLEYHVKFEVDERTPELINIVHSLGGHTAQNIAKNTDFIFVTVRSDNDYQKLMDTLIGYKKVSTIRECVVFDDNRQIDSNWKPYCTSCFLKEI